MSKAQITALELIARRIGVSPQPFKTWALQTRQEFGALTEAAYGSDTALRSCVVSAFLASL